MMRVMKRYLVVALLAVALVGCGKEGEGGGDSKAIDTYVNTDLAPAFAQLMASRKAIGDLKADHINDEGMTDYLRMRVGERALPTMDAFFTEIAKVTPPQSMAALHAQLIEYATEEKATLTALNAALSPVSVDGWRAGHDRLMEATQRATRWEIAFDAQLKKAGVTWKPVAPAKYPEPPAVVDNSPKGPCGGKACPCEAGSEKMDGDVLISCVLTEEKAVGEQLCAPGPVTFRADGSFESCESALMFVPFELPPTTPKGEIPLCGGGRIVRGADGKVTSCVIVSDLKVGDNTLAKGSVVDFDSGGAASLAK